MNSKKHNASDRNRSPGILLIDDDPAQRKAIAGLLEMRNYTCLEAGKGEEAIELLRTNASQIDACILDQKLENSRLSGLDTLRAIRSEHPSLPVLVFTAYESSEAAAAVAAGATLFIRKPFEPPDLITAVDSLVLMHSLAKRVAVTDEQRDLLQRSIDAMAAEVMLMDKERKVIMVNAAKRKAAALEDQDVEGRTCAELVCRTEQNCAGCAFGDRNEAGTALMREVISNGRVLLIHTEPVYDDEQQLKYYVQTGLDVTRRKRTIDLMLELSKLATKTEEEIADFVANYLHTQLSYARVRIYLGVGTRLHGVVSRGMGATFVMEDYPFPHENIYSARALAERQPFLMGKEDLENDPYFELFDKQGVKHQLQVPLVSASGVVGLISLDDKGSEARITLEDADLMSLVSTAIADAIITSRQNQTRERRLAWYKALQRIDNILTTSPRVSEVLQSVIVTLTELVGADSGVVMTRRGAESHLRVCAISAGVDRRLLRVKHSGDSGMIGRCMQEDRQVYVQDIWNDLDFKKCYAKLKDRDWKRFLSEATSVIIEPVRCGDVSIGVLFLRFSQPADLHWIDLEFIDDIARRVAIALAKLDEAQRVEAALIQQAKLSDLALLTAGVAHGIRNPLTLVLSSLEKTRRDLEMPTGNIANPTEFATNLRYVEGHVHRAFATIDRLVEWARPQGLTPTWVSLSDLASSLVELVCEEFEDRKIKLTTQIEPNVPLVHAPPSSLRMALADLFWNAAKAMPSGGELCVRCAEFGNPPRVELDVVDSGKGMSEQEVDRLFAFDPFEPLPAGGTGLGLYLCRKVLDSVGGQLKCQSEPNRGTTFTVILPAQPEHIT